MPDWMSWFKEFRYTSLSIAALSEILAYNVELKSLSKTSSADKDACLFHTSGP